MEVENEFEILHSPSDWASNKISHEEPDICPFCKKSIQPVFLCGFCDEDTNRFWAIYECRACFNLFLKQSNFIRLNAQSCYEMDPNDMRLYPRVPERKQFSSYIDSISPKFIDIYNQAYAAECYGLSEVAGIGYRKSIEFLIKDYLIRDASTEEDKEKILKTFLGTCINSYIDNENIKSVASRAVWLGNDETHYLRVHEDKDISDLKRLINLTVNWIEMELMTAEAIEGIQPIK